MDFAIRSMRPDDAKAWLKVHRAAVRGTAAQDYPVEVIAAWAPIPLTTEAIDQVRTNPDREYRLVAEVGGAVVGIAALVFERMELRACYVTPESGRKGVGAALLRALEEVARERGLQSLELDSSLTAEAFYRRQGYQFRGNGQHVLCNGQIMTCVKMHKTLSA